MRGGNAGGGPRAPAPVRLLPPPPAPPARPTREGREDVDATTADVDRYRANRQDEIDSAAVYRTMAGREANPELATIYSRLAEVEERHLAFWDEQLRIAGVEPGPP